MSKKEWKSCHRCGLSAFRRRVVYGDGDIHADILFIGEAPGKSEDLRGKPFIGPSGKILRKAIKEAIKSTGIYATYYVTNVVGCRPTDLKNGPNRQPERSEALACRPRLYEIADRVQPEIVVFLGRVAETFAGDIFPSGIHAFHPAYILRKGGTNSTEYRALIRTIEDALKQGEEKPRKILD